MNSITSIYKKAVLSQGEPRNAAANFDTYRILQRHRVVSLPQHGFLVGLFLQTADNAGLFSKVSEEVTTAIAKKCCRQPHCSLTPPPWETSANIHIYLIFLETSIIDLHLHYAADSVSLSSLKFFSGGLHKTHLFCKSAHEPFKVIQGHYFWYESKARMRLPISSS